MKPSNFRHLLTILAFLLLYVCPSTAVQCKELFFFSEIQRHQQIVQKQQEIVKKTLIPIEVTPVTQRAFTNVYNEVDSDRAVQTFSPGVIEEYNRALKEERSISYLSDSCKDRIDRFIKNKIFPPSYAVEVAKYLEGYELSFRQIKSVEELINLKAEELVLEKIDAFFKRSSGQSLYLKATDDETRQARDFISHPKIWLLNRKPPSSKSELPEFRESLRHGKFINDLIVQAYEEILYERGFALPPAFKK